MRTLLRVALIGAGLYGSIVLYHFQLGAVPFFLLSFYFFYEAYKAIRYGDREDPEDSGILNSQE
ncbi:hypothetical protein LCM10_08770 [Rossellomorea aquimaris]|uniref:hypothetical protein n=1 Tax=Rossellomorea aquimaris TaxID=189382 RepID=UPI001CD6E9B9|nr:hypothetical protein [Rossellomorea aquimaris]MCA1055077.1 hypothetical protein [Rossellomorea aquimaris]